MDNLGDDEHLLTVVNSLAPRLVIAAGDDDDAPVGKRLKVQDSDGESLPSPRERNATEERVALGTCTNSVSLAIHSDSDSEQEAGKTSAVAVGVGPKRWRVGASSGHWIHSRRAPLEEQSQVLLGSVMANLMKLSTAQARQVCAMLRPGVELIATRTSWAVHLCHMVLAVPARYLQDCLAFIWLRCSSNSFRNRV